MTAARARRRLLTGTAVALALVVAGAGAATAFWSTTGTGAGSARTATLDPPPAAGVTAAGDTTSSVAVTVSAAPTTGAPVHGYRVDRSSPSAATGVCFITGTTGTCSASASGSGQQQYSVVSYRGTAASPSWTSSTGTGVTGTPLAAVAGVSPDARGQNSVATTVTLTGSGFTSGSGLAASFGSGTTTTAVTYVSATTLTASVVVDAGAAVGQRDVTVTNGGTGTTLTCARCFSVNAAPTLSAGSPAAANIVRGSTHTYAINGTGFVSGFTATTSDANFVVTQTSFADSTSITVTVRNDYTNNGQKSATLTITNPDGGRVTTGAVLRN